MKFAKQFLLILLISFIGQILHLLIPLPVPAGIYGMVLLFVGLLTGLIKLSYVEDAGKFLLDVMPLMFIPAGVRLITGWSVLKPILWQVLVISIATNVTVMVAVGYVSQLIIRAKNKKADKNE